jgi:hypothetical protein
MPRPVRKSEDSLYTEGTEHTEKINTEKKETTKPIGIEKKPGTRFNQKTACHSFCFRVSPSVCSVPSVVKSLQLFVSAEMQVTGTHSSVLIRGISEIRG